MASLVVVVAGVYVARLSTGSAMVGSAIFAPGVDRPNGLACSRVPMSLPARPSDDVGEPSALSFASMVPVLVMLGWCLPFAALSS